MRVYVLVQNDHHFENVEVYVFRDQNQAIVSAKKRATDYATNPKYVQEKLVEGWLFFARYSLEDDYVGVEEKRLIQPVLV